MDTSSAARLQELVQAAVRRSLKTETPASPDAAPPPAAEAVLAAAAAPIQLSLPRYGRYHAAAAVLATFRYAELKPVPAGDGPELPDDTLGDLIADSIPVTTPGGEERWKLADAARQEMLRRLGSRARLEWALAANPEHPSDEPAQEMFEAYLRGQAPPLEEQDVRQVSGTFEVSQWLDGLPSQVRARLELELPPWPAVVARRDRLTLLQPFSELAGDHFAGREAELKRLRGYVGVIQPGGWRASVQRAAEEILDLQKKPPLVIHGPGGRGKSALVARFILEHATLPNTERFPWAYLDFDRATLNPEEPLTLLIEAARQLGVQYPDARDYCTRVRRQWQSLLPQGAGARRGSGERRGTAASADGTSSADRWKRGVEDFKHLIQNVKVEKAPFLLVLDTFEEVQQQADAVVLELCEFLRGFQRAVPRLRTIISGRAPLEVKDFATDPLELGDFTLPARTSFLQKRGLPAELARVVAKQVGGNPLSLKLAVDLWRAGGVEAGGIKGLPEGIFSLFLRENQIEAFLFNRILERIRDREVARLAHPGLALRRITPALIREVLAGPCGVKLHKEDDAERLWNALRQYVSLVTVEGDALRHRPDVRRAMIHLVRAKDPERVRQIEEAAVAYYEQEEGPVARAEEIYHRLSLRQPLEEIRKRWIPEARRYLTKATAEELEPLEQASLLTLLGHKLPSNLRGLADLHDWERDTAREAGVLLHKGRAKDALQRLRQRKERTPGSPLFLLEILALKRAQQWKEAAKVTERGLASAVERGDRALAIRLRLEGAHVYGKLGQWEKARQLLDEADAIAGRGGYADNVVHLLEIGLHRRALERGTEGPLPAAASREELHRRFARLSPQPLAARPALALWSGAELGQGYPDVLRSVITAHGIDTSQKSRLRLLANALAQWDAREPRGEALSAVLGDGGAGGESRAEAWARWVLNAGAPLLTRALLPLLDEVVPSAGVAAALADLLWSAAHPILAREGHEDLLPAPGTEESLPVTGSAAPSAAALKLTDEHLEELQSALRIAFPSRASLARMLGARMERSLDALALTQNHSEAVSRLVRIAQAEGWSAQLLAVALEARPDHAGLLKVAAAFGLTAWTPGMSPAERTPGEPTALDEVAWRERLGRIETRVCRIDVGRGKKAAIGTGFLLGPDLLMTHRTVVAGLLDGKLGRGDVTVRFDHRRLPGGDVVREGTVYHLAREWQVDDSPPEDLGYALLRVAGFPGLQPIGELAEANAEPRGWIGLSTEDPAVRAGSALYILHHGAKGVLQLAGGKILATNRENSRLAYEATRGRGSAGAPCFDAEWRLLALHGANVYGGSQGRVAEAVPLNTVVARVREHGIGVLDSQPDGER
jgi:hypothetical protein